MPVLESAAVLVGFYAGKSLITWPAFSWAIAKCQTSPKYKVIKPLGKKKTRVRQLWKAELRLYEPFLIAEVTAAGKDTREAVSNATRQLNAFILGENEGFDDKELNRRRKVLTLSAAVLVDVTGSKESQVLGPDEGASRCSSPEMELNLVDAPQSPHGALHVELRQTPARAAGSEDGDNEEKVPILPAAAEPSGDGSHHKVSFVLPQTFTIETVPKPTNPDIVIREMPRQVVAAYRFHASAAAAADPKTVAAKRAKLESLLRDEGLSSSGEAAVVQFHPAWTHTPGPMRDNELTLVVDNYPMATALLLAGRTSSEELLQVDDAPSDGLPGAKAPMAIELQPRLQADGSTTARLLAPTADLPYMPPTSRTPETDGDSPSRSPEPEHERPWDADDADGLHPWDHSRGGGPTSQVDEMLWWSKAAAAKGLKQAGETTKVVGGVVAQQSKVASLHVMELSRDLYDKVSGALASWRARS